MKKGGDLIIEVVSPLKRQNRGFLRSYNTYLFHGLFTKRLTNSPIYVYINETFTL